MENKVLRNIISIIVIMTMVIVSTIVPVVLNGNIVEASTPSNNEAAEATVEKGNSSSKFKLDRRSYSNGKQAGTDVTREIKASASSNRAVIPSPIVNNKTSTFEFIGDGQDILAGTFNGQTSYVPFEYVISLPGYSPTIGYFVDDDDIFLDPPYKVNITPYYMGKYTLTVTFVRFEWNSVDEEWDYSGPEYDDVKTYSFDAQGYVSFNKNKGAFKTGGTPKLVKNGSTYGTLPTMKTRKGYSFAGWYSAISAGQLIKSTSKVTIKKNTTLFAQWKYKITLNANKGKIGKKKTKKKTVTSGLKYGKLSTPKRSKYNFAGWHTKKKGGTWVNASSYNKNPSKHTLYAHWVKKSKYATKSQYKAIKVGMTYNEVKRIFGRKYSVKRSGDGYVNYAWLTKSRRSGAAVLFINGKVFAKDWV